MVASDSTLLSQHMELSMKWSTIATESFICAQLISVSRACLPFCSTHLPFVIRLLGVRRVPVQSIFGFSRHLARSARKGGSPWGKSIDRKARLHHVANNFVPLWFHYHFTPSFISFDSSDVEVRK